MSQDIFKADFPLEIVQEGKVKIFVPKLKAFVKSPSEYAPSKAPVFYNPVMELNRDMAVLALQAYQRMLNREISVCEPLTGCGVRGIRFAREVKGVKEVLISDINERAFQLAKHNVQMNHLDERVTVKNEEANSLLGCHGAPHKRFDVIDIDPFGSPVPYLDSAIRALHDGGLLALTATDMAPLCGVHPKACIRKYGGKPLRTEYCHELAVRILAGCLATTAAKYDMGTSVVFCHSTDHYIRIYALIRYGARKADESIKEIGYILHCFNCFHREIAKETISTSGTCSECDSKLSFAGPLWIGKIFDSEFCDVMEDEARKRMLRLKERIRKMLALIKSETEIPNLYYVVDKFCQKLNLPSPPVRAFVESLRKEGVKASLTHFNSRGIRTSASAICMREILRNVLKNRNRLE
ncbi:tRNA (guanine(10)-N(2))-dimethyltransferase [Candidatus Bathyarchaeota archaeon]|nr:tRNA (guanine(10)-N(2))-dimethyltransferase [Candidatus Bathyarchaeota archaeon]